MKTHQCTQKLAAFIRDRRYHLGWFGEIFIIFYTNSIAKDIDRLKVQHPYVVFHRNIIIRIFANTAVPYLDPKQTFI
jgi:hypothetical protein